MEVPRVSVAVLLICLMSFAGAEECYRGKGVKESGRVFLSNCEQPPCILKKKTKTQVELKFAPQENIEALTNSVSAEVFGVQLPFVGVNGANVCNKVYDAETKEKVSCPLTAGKEYLYKDEFDILEVYPKLKVLVHWALISGKKQVLCFEVPARIV